MDTKMVQQVKEVVHSNPTAEALLAYMAVRERNRSRSDMRRIRVKLIEEKFDVNDTQYWQAVEALEKIGAGKVRYSPRGNIRYMDWKVSVKDLGRAAFEGTTIPKPVSKVRRLLPKPKTIAQKPQVIVMMPLENGDLVQLSKHDMERIASTLQKLKE